MMRKRVWGYVFLLLFGLAATLTGCDDMHDQPSIKPQEAPRRTAPAAAVPIQGKLTVTWQSQLSNPADANDASLQRGAELYRINCEMCHGTREAYPGAVGKKLAPPPTSLHDPRISSLTDGDLFKRITLGFGRMPAFQNHIAELDRWHLVNYLRSFHRTAG